ncbi:MAG: hypothetical protein WC503_04390 [Candidatus Shapirobacteria bacterium]
MNQDFEEYLAKKRDLLDAYCTCGGEFKAFVDKNDCYGLCPNCGKKSYQLSCKKCQSGFSFGEDNPIIDKIGNCWTCPQCNEVNHGLPDLMIKLYRNEEIPKEVKKEEDGRTLLPKWAVYLIMGMIAIVYIFIKFIK